MKDTRDSAFSKKMHCLSGYVDNLRNSLNSSRENLKITTRVSFPDEEMEVNTPKQSVDFSKSLPSGYILKVEPTISKKIIPSCSLVEYQAIIDEAPNQLEVVRYLKRTSSELNVKIGGAVCPADTNIIKEEDKWLVNVKWALPMDNFALEGAPDPDELAQWILEKLPPKDPTAMSSCKGIFIDLDMSFFSDLTRKALLKWSTLSSSQEIKQEKK